MANENSNTEVQMNAEQIIQMPQTQELLSMVEKAIKEVNQKLSANKLNVLILGKTGVGKSTLINAVFGKNVAETASGKPVTQDTQEYKIDDNFSIFDSKGLEVKDYQAIKGEMDEWLGNMSKKKVSEQIHIAWLCIQEPGRRVEDADKELWELLKTHHIPSFVVITKATQDKDENDKKFSDLVREEFDTDRVERVRALEIEDDDGNKKELKGIKELINQTYCLLPEAQREAFARRQKYDKSLKRTSAEKAILAYVAGAGVVAATPIPFSDIALLIPTQCAMIVHISKIYDLELSMDSAKKVIVAFAGVVGLGYVAKTLIANLTKFIPIAGSAINATTATTITKLMGEAYIAYLEHNFEHLKEAISNISADALKQFFTKVSEKK